MAHFRRLHFLTADKAGHLHHDAHQHHRTGLRGFTGEGHDAGEDPFAALTGDHFVHISDVGIGIPRHVVDTAAAKAGNGRNQQQQRIDVAQPGIIEDGVRKRGQAKQYHHHAVGRRRTKANAQRDHPEHGEKLEDGHRTEQVRGH